MDVLGFARGLIFYKQVGREVTGYGLCTGPGQNHGFNRSAPETAFALLYFFLIFESKYLVFQLVQGHDTIP